MIACLARHDNIRTGGDGKFAKVTEGAAQNGDGAARALGIAPYTRVASEGRGSTGGKIAQRARVVERRKRAKAGRLGVVYVLQRAHGHGVQQLT